MALPEAVKQEIERKFLVAELPADIGSYPLHNIHQGYVALDPNGTEVRLRDTDGVFTMTAKAGTDLLVRAEPEVEVDKAFFDTFWPLTFGRQILKHRYDIALANERTAELDIFAGNLAGFRLVEVEFPDRETAGIFVPPTWFGSEVTQDKRYKNKHLAVNGRPE